MPWVDVIWTDENEAHLAGHGMSRDDAERVVRNPTTTGISRSSGRPFATGFAADGRRIIVVYEEIDAVTVYPITA